MANITLKVKKEIVTYDMLGVSASGLRWALVGQNTGYIHAVFCEKMLAEDFAKMDIRDWKIQELNEIL